MGLRAKVAVMLVASIVPIALLFSVWRVASEHRQHLERRADRFVTRMHRRPMKRCERRPEQFRLERPEFVGFAYDGSFASRNPQAPPFPQELRTQLTEVGEPVHYWFTPAERFLGVTAVRFSETGPCSVILVGWKEGSAPTPAYNRAFTQTAGLALLLAILGALVTFPIVRRIRRLEHAVRDARRDDFDPELRGDDEINALANAFADTLKAVRQREEALEEYIANTTHDLAIPLTVLQHRLRKIADQHDSDDARVALEESHYIGALIANMRTAAKLENLDAIDLTHEVVWNDVVERVVQRHRPIAEQKGVELNWSIPEDVVSVTGEPTLAEQALSNLVQNAVQYNVSGGHVSVVLDTVEGGFEVVVADDGPGVPEQFQESILERGVRDDEARSRNEGGQGFGLAIVRRVCALHGWELELEHSGGLTVRISSSERLPASG